MLTNNVHIDDSLKKAANDFFGRHSGRLNKPLFCLMHRTTAAQLLGFIYAVIRSPVKETSGTISPDIRALCHEFDTTLGENMKRESIFIVDAAASSRPIGITIQIIRAMAEYAQIIVFSANSSKEYVKEIMLAGADDFLVLPPYLAVPTDINKYGYEEAMIRDWSEPLMQALYNAAERFKHRVKTVNSVNWYEQLLTKYNLRIRRMRELDGHMEFRLCRSLEEIKLFLEAELGRSVFVRDKSRVLVVDDELDRLQLMEALLKKDYTVVKAENGQQALEKLSSFDGVVLLDIMLPDIKGTELVPQIKAKSPLTEIIMSTAYEEQEYITETLRNGAFDFVVKSSDNEMEEIKDKVKNAADKAYYESILGHLICKYELKIIENIGERKKAEM